MLRNDVIRLLDDADVFMFPTYSEGFSVSLLEAMARGLPCLTTDVGANKEMLENIGGVIVKPRDSAAVIKAFKMLSLSETRYKMSMWNLQKVREEYTEEKVLREFVSIYRGTINNVSTSNKKQKR